VSNNGLRVRSQLSKSRELLSAIVLNAMNARKSSSTGAMILPPALLN
jgi:hypothetical protein